jgi:hypothetical protein
MLHQRAGVDCVRSLGIGDGLHYTVVSHVRILTSEFSLAGTISYHAFLNLASLEPTL